MRPDALVRSGPSGAAGMLTLQERDDLAFFLASGLVSAGALAPHRRHDLDAADPVNVPNGNGSASAVTANAFKGF